MKKLTTMHINQDKDSLIGVQHRLCLQCNTICNLQSHPSLTLKDVIKIVYVGYKKMLQNKGGGGDLEVLILLAFSLLAIILII